MGHTINQAIVVSRDVEGWIRAALRSDVDEPVVIARDNNVAIQRGARYVPHRMSTGAFEGNAFVLRPIHRAVPELCLFPREDHTPNPGGIARDRMPIQIQDSSILYCDRPLWGGAGHVVLQLK